RPSPKLLKLSATIGRRSRSSASCSTPSPDSIQTPVRPLRDASASLRSSQSLSGTITSPDSGTAGRAPSAPGLSSCQLSSATRRLRINFAIDVVLEFLVADAVRDFDEALRLAVPVVEVALDEALDDVGHLGARERRADHLAERCLNRAGVGLALVAADLDLVPLLVVLVDAENPDVADMVVAAGV